MNPGQAPRKLGACVVARPGGREKFMHVTLLTAQSLDGFITRHGVPGSGFTSAEDKAHFRAALADFDCCVMGAVTYRGPREWIRRHVAAPHRPCVVLTRAPERHQADAEAGVIEFTAAPPKKILADLEARGCRRCALLGGGQAHSVFFSAGLVDELWLTIEPLLFGAGTPLLAAPADVRLELLTEEKLNAAGTLLLRYRVTR